MPSKFIDNASTSKHTGPTNATSAQGRYWILTIPFEEFEKPTGLAKGLLFCRGQAEEGAGGFKHWQVVAAFEKKTRLRGVKNLFGNQCHAELSRSAAANEYVQKDDTYIEGTRFSFGEAPLKRNDKTDWDKVKSLAIAGNIDAVPADIFIKHYHTLKKIKLDNMVFEDKVKNVRIYWGVSGSGKSHRAREEAGPGAYIKDPCTKWWDGYRPEEHDSVIIEEFTGTINISHMLRWLDKWGSAAEAKQGGVPFKAGNIWITSNVNPVLWYPDANPEQVAALMRRCTITEFKEVYKAPVKPHPPTDNRVFWENAPKHEGIPIGDVMEVPEWRDYLGDLLDDEPGPSTRVPGYFYAEDD